MCENDAMDFVKYRIVECNYERRAYELWVDFLFD